MIKISNVGPGVMPNNRLYQLEVPGAKPPITLFFEHNPREGLATCLYHAYKAAIQEGFEYKPYGENQRMPDFMPE